MPEGVETEGQLATVRRLGCDYAQGFLFSPPVASPAAAALLTQPAPWMRYFGGSFDLAPSGSGVTRT